MPSHAFTISKLADAVGVNIETVRYYQRRGLLAEPTRASGGFRSYDQTHVRRLSFIKRAQELGFSLDDVAELLSLSSATDRVRVREITHARVEGIREKIAQLEAMAQALSSLEDCCAKTAASRPCPIIAALADTPLESQDTAQDAVSSSPSCKHRVRTPALALDGST